MDSLIDLTPIKEIAVALINKLSEGAGWIATHDTPKRKALDVYIKEIENSSLPSLEKAIKIRNAKKDLKEYANQRKIVRKIVDNSFANLKESANPKSVDDDWLAQFMDRARLVSNDELQLIWGRILAEECNVPKSIPKLLLHILSQMDVDDARRFLDICSVSVNYKEDNEITYVPIFLERKMGDFYKTVKYDDLVNLETLGLIQHNRSIFPNGYSCSIIEKPFVVHYFDHNYIFPENLESFPCGDVILTKAGDALARTITPSYVEGFWDNICLPLFKKAGNPNKIPDDLLD